MAAVITEPGEVEQAQGELPLTPVQILDRAIAWIEEHGWCQRAREYTDGRVCTIGALCRGAGYSNFGFWVLPFDDSALMRAATGVLDAIGVPGSVPAFSIPLVERCAGTPAPT